MIILKNMTKVYETVNYNIIALSDINYTLSKGEVVVLLGKSGSGKSTLLNILGGFDREYAGSYILDSEDMKDKTEREIDTIRKRRIGFVFQHYVLLNNLNVRENVELALRVTGVVSKESRSRAALHALKLVGLEGHGEKYPFELSGGQRQRVAIARAFVKNPDIIIADEPTAALDTKTSNEILELLKDLCRTKLLIIATHNKAIVRDFGSRVIELKSGYTVKNELINDRTQVRVDELDLIIDQSLNISYQKPKDVVDIEEKIVQDNKATVLKDLGVDLTGFKINEDEKFDIDEEEKRKLIKKRMQESKLNTRIYRFLQTTDDFHGKRQYAISSFMRNIGLHLFSALIFTVFLLTIVFGLNFVSETFGGFNEKAMYTREMKDHNELFFSQSVYEMLETDKGAYYEYKDFFIDDFSQTEIEDNRFFKTLFDDPYYRYQYDQELVKYIDTTLTNQGYDDIFKIYYNNSSIVYKSNNNEIVFEELGNVYQNIVTFPEPYVSVTDFLSAELDEGLLYQFDFLYSNHNEDVLSKHMLRGGRLPETATEVVIPVSYLFDYEILNPSDFDDEQVIPSNQISDAFFLLPEEDRTIEITKSILTFSDYEDNYTMDVTRETETFTVVGLINFDGDINPYISIREDVYIQNNSGDYFSFIFNEKAKESINFEVIDLSVKGEFTQTIQYAEISKENYKLYNIDQIIDSFNVDYQERIESDIYNQFNEWITTLNNATILVSDYVDADLAGTNPNPTFLNNLVDNDMFVGLTYRDLLRYYIAQHMSVIKYGDEFRTICPNCSIAEKNTMDLLEKADNAYEILKDEPDFIDVLENYGDPSRLTYQESTNLIIYNEYGHLLNNEYYASFDLDDYELSLVSSFEQEKGGILTLVYVVVPRIALDNIPFLESIVEMLQGLEESASFNRFMQNTNMDLLISSLSTNALRSIVMVVLYIVIYLILFFSIVFLSLVMINLYGNIYESATRKRIKELASLRILGSSYDDIHDMIRIENRIVALFSYGSFILILFILSRLNFFTNAPISHYYLPLLGIFFDFNVYDVFIMNRLVIIFVSLIFYVFIYRFIIRRVSTRKISNIDTIKAIRDGDNL